jgi:hypothetical protein
MAPKNIFDKFVSAVNEQQAPTAKNMLKTYFLIFNYHNIMNIK